MAVYKMTMEDLANYISDTTYQFKINSVVSSVGKRSEYDLSFPIAIKAIEHKEIQVQVDCFLDGNNNIKARVKLPQYQWSAITDELSLNSSKSSYRLECYSPKRTFTYDIPKTLLLSFEDFERVSENLLLKIEQELTEDINKFHTTEGYIIEGIKTNIFFTAYPSANHELENTEPER